MDDSDSKLAVLLGACKISKWEMDGEDSDQEKSEYSSDNNEIPPIRKLFVSNLSHKATHWDLRCLFDRYGKVIDVHISRNRAPCQKRQYGFVTYKYPEDALSVLKLKRGQLKLHRRNLYVAAANSWNQPIELPDGTIILKGSRHQPLRYFREATYPEAQIYNEGLLPTVSTEGNRETEAVGSSDLPPHTSSYNGVEQQQEGETGNGGDEREVEGTECMIDILNNDCLMHIFSFLNKRERFGIERVCKRWQAVGLKMWMCQKHLDFASLFPAASEYILSKSMLETVLKRCGANLKSLDISQHMHHEPKLVLQIIAHYCRNLQCLSLADLPVKSSGLRKLSEVCQNLRVLNLDGCEAVDRDLSYMFQKTPHLESLTLSHNYALNGECLTCLARTPLKVLVLDRCNNLRSQNLVKGLLVLKNLLSLSLGSCMSLTSSCVANIVAAVPRLQSLSMEGHFPSFNPTTLKVLGQLCDIISLNLKHNPAVNDEILDVITRSCHKLEELNISGCSSDSWEHTSLTDIGLRCLAALPNLIYLTMSYMANISVEAVASRGKLRKLVCQGCPCFTDVGCISVVTSCNELELFDFSGCDLVSDATVQAALDSVKLRTKDIKLKLIVGGTRVSNCITVEENSLLEVDQSDLSVTHLRPDFGYDFPSSGEEYDYDSSNDYDTFDDYDHSDDFSDLDEFDSDNGILDYF